MVGCGDAFGSGGRGSAAFLVRGGTGAILLDCGPGAPAGLKRLGVRPASLDAVLISHFHGDHFGGVPFLFLEARYLEARERPLAVAGPPGVEERVTRLCGALYQGGAASPEPGLARFVELRPGTATPVGPAEVEPFAVEHAEGEACLGLAVQMEGRRIVYSGDTRWFPGLGEAARGADLFLWECTNLDEKHGEHTRLVDVLRHRGGIGCRRLLLTHLGPAVLARRGDHDLPWAEDGMRLSL